MATQTDTWEYDQQHPEGFNTLKGDENFKPPEAELSVAEQRRLSETKHKNETGTPLVSVTPEDAGDNPQTVLQRRRSSVNSNGPRRRSSRKATGSYGGEDSDLKPLSSLTSDEKKSVLESGNNPLYFTSGLPNTTTSGAK